MGTEYIEGYVVDIACLRGYSANDTLERAREHTTRCALMGHCVESGYGLVDEIGRVQLLDTHATPRVVAVLQQTAIDRGIRLSAEREDDGGEKRTAHIELSP